MKFHLCISTIIKLESLTAFPNVWILNSKHTEVSSHSKKSRFVEVNSFRNCLISSFLCKNLATDIIFFLYSLEVTTYAFFIPKLAQDNKQRFHEPTHYFYHGIQAAFIRGRKQRQSASL